MTTADDVLAAALEFDALEHDPTNTPAVRAAYWSKFIDTLNNYAPTLETPC